MGGRRPATVVTLALAVLAAGGCGPASGGDPELWAPVSGLGVGGGGSGAGGEAGVGATGTTGTMGGGGDGGAGTVSMTGQPQMSLTFTTVSFNGEYAPKNVGAVWVEDAGGAFVKTLEIWGAKRLKYLTTWKTASDGNAVDAVTGATRKSHGEHQLAWDLRGLDGQILPDGLYHVHIELTEQNDPGVGTILDLEKGAVPFEGTPADTPYFIGQHVLFEPDQ